MATLNLWGLNQWEQRRAAVTAFIHRVRPDVLGLQEVVQNDDGESQADWLAEQTGMTATFRGFPRESGFFGNATLSRFEPVEAEALTLPSLDNLGEQRLCLRTGLDTPRGICNFYNTHLNHLFNHGYVREAQVTAISEFVESGSQRNFPPVLMGDFNALPTSSEIRYLKGLTSLNSRSYHLFDSFEVANPRIIGATWNNRNPFAALNRVPDQRIDYIFVGVRALDGAGYIHQSRLDFDVPVQGIYPSDHFGVVTDIEFPTRAPQV